jgi:hypothetical protein
MKLEKFMKILRTMNFLVFLLVSIVIISIFYEGVTLKWYPIVPILIIIADISFIVATILNIIFNRKVKILLYFNTFSVLFIVIAVIMKIFNITYPHWGFVLWNFYILYFFGAQVVINIYKNIQYRSKNVF